MSNGIRSLSDAEIEAVSGGLQYNDNPQNYFMSPPPVDPQVVVTNPIDASPSS